MPRKFGKHSLKAKKDIFVVVLFFAVRESLICYCLPCISQVGEIGWPVEETSSRPQNFLFGRMSQGVVSLEKYLSR